MAKSYVEKVTDTMHQLLWNNILREFVYISIPTIPVVGQVFLIPVVGKVFLDIVMKLIETYLEYPLFLILSRRGVFTSIDWKEDKIYNAYEVEAKKVVLAQDKDAWDPKERKEFRDAARALIRYSNMHFSE